MIKFFKNLFSYQIDPLEDYTFILEQIVKWILIVLVAAGMPAAAIGIIEAIQLHQPQSALFYFALFLPIVILLMDIQMPEMNGYDATREIRQFNKNVIIIAQTAFAISGDRKKAMDAGCNDYFTKPINKGDLLEKIQKCFSV